MSTMLIILTALKFKSSPQIPIHHTKIAFYVSNFRSGKQKTIWRHIHIRNRMWMYLCLCCCHSLISKRSVDVQRAPRRSRKYWSRRRILSHYSIEFENYTSTGNETFLAPKPNGPLSADTTSTVKPKPLFDNGGELNHWCTWIIDDLQSVNPPRGIWYHDSTCQGQLQICCLLVT